VTDGRQPPDPPSDSELNPLLNPVLGQNLQQWAQVYFSNPPEKRNQAVLELLRELEGRPAIGPMTRQLLCPACGQENEAGQKFCGICGSPLEAASGPEVRRAHSFGPVSSENDVQWLRERAFTSLEEYDAPKNRGWKYLLAAVLVILAAGFAYLRWTSRLPLTLAPRSSVAGPPQAAFEPRPTPTAPPQPTQEQPSPEQISPAKKTGADQNRVAGHEDPPQAPTNTAARSGQELASDRAVLPSDESTDSGTQELLLAERYLDGWSGARNTTEAAKWLWKAVGKKNTRAVVLLADLYTRGDGVPKSCDQARLLLITAAKKGVPEAGQKLQRLRFDGCQ
jgi:hypothetical protein